MPPYRAVRAGSRRKLPSHREIPDSADAYAATIVLGARPDDPAKGYLGVTPGEGARPPLEV
ncbi:hypothetical protein AB0346_32420, partial [Nocardia beijingensis]